MANRRNNSSSTFNPINSLARWINLGVVLATLLTYLSPMVNPTKTWVFTIIGLAYPFLVLANIAFVAFWLWRRRIYFLFSLCVLLVGLGHLQNLYGWHFIKSNKTAEDEIIIMTYNIAGLGGSKSYHTQEKRMEALAKLFQIKPHILCMQEVSNQQQLENIKKELGYPFHYKSKGTVLFSQFPFVRQDGIDFSNAENGCLWAELQTPKGIIRVYNLHLQSNKMTQTAIRITTEGDFREKETWKDVRFVLASYKRGAQIRSEQVAMIKTHIAKSSVPVIVCGDLNDTPFSYVYHQISEKLNDSFSEAGSGLGSTFAGKLPALRIDYILAEKRYKITYHKVLKSELSDHFPVLVKLKL